MWNILCLFVENFEVKCEVDLLNENSNKGETEFHNVYTFSIWMVAKSVKIIFSFQSSIENVSELLAFLKEYYLLFYHCIDNTL